MKTFYYLYKNGAGNIAMKTAKADTMLDAINAIRKTFPEVLSAGIYWACTEDKSAISVRARMLLMWPAN